MLKNYLKTALRILFMNKIFFLINMLGLSIGISASLLILSQVNFDRSFDKFNDNYQHVFRLRYERTSNNGESVRFASCSPPAAPAIRQQIPEIEKAGRLFKSRSVVRYGEKTFLEDRVFYTEPEIMEILKFNFTEGNPLKDLALPGKAFLSQSFAHKYFGMENPLGKKLIIDKNFLFDVAGIFEDNPANSHLKCDILLSYKSLEAKYGPEVLESWGETGFYTYLRLHPGYDLSLIKSKLAALVEREAGELFRYYDIKAELPLQPLADIHLTSHFMHEYETNGDAQITDILFFIALLILVIAWVNYINLSTAQSLNRAKEIGLRKVIGATKKNLVVQLFMEVIIVNSIAIFLALLLTWLSVPSLADIAGAGAETFIFFQSWFLPTLLLIFFSSVFLSGLVPVLIVSSFSVSDALKGKIIQKPGGLGLRKYLVVTQFIFAIILMVAAITIFQQIDFLKKQKLGFEKDNILVVQMPRIREDSFKERLESFKNSLLQNNIIKSISCVTEVPGRQIYWDAGGIHRAGADVSESRNYQIVGIDYDYIPLFNLQLLAGRNFSREYTTDTKGLILNETAVSLLGFNDINTAIGQKVDYWGELFTVVGVIKDFHQQSPKAQFEPHIYRFLPDARAHRGVFAVKVNADIEQDAVSLFKENYAAFFPGNPFEHFFLDEYYNQQYEPDLKFARIIQLFTGLAIFITMIGLFGISLYTTERRTKEIGIRKVMGSSTVGIVMLLSKEFIKWVIMAVVVAWPVAYYLVGQWLATFAFHIEISWWILALSGLSAVIITLLTISYQSVKAALSNPVDSLRYE